MRVQGFLPVADLNHIMIAHRNEPSQPPSRMNVWHTPRGGACSRKTFASRRSVRLCSDSSSRTGRHMQHTTSCTVSSSSYSSSSSSRRRSQMRPTKCSFKRKAVTMRAHVRQCDPSLSFYWHNDTFHEVHALLQNQLQNALSTVVFKFHLIETFSHFHACPCD